MERYKGVFVSSVLTFFTVLMLAAAVYSTFRVVYAGEKIEIAEEEPASDNEDNGSETVDE